VITVELTDAEALRLIRIMRDEARRAKHCADRAYDLANDQRFTGRTLAGQTARHRTSHRIAASVVTKLCQAFDPPISADEAAQIDREQARAEINGGTR
jgi:hypothetical protein